MHHRFKSGDVSFNKSDVDITVTKCLCTQNIYILLTLAFLAERNLPNLMFDTHFIYRGTCCSVDNNTRKIIFQQELVTKNYISPPHLHNISHSIQWFTSKQINAPRAVTWRHTEQGLAQLESSLWQGLFSQVRSAIDSEKSKEGILPYLNGWIPSFIFSVIDITLLLEHMLARCLSII